LVYKSNLEMIKNFMISWLVCLFNNLDIKIKSKWDILKYIILQKWLGMIKIVVYLLKYLKKDI